MAIRPTDWPTSAVSEPIVFPGMSSSSKTAFVLFRRPSVPAYVNMSSRGQWEKANDSADGASMRLAVKCDRLVFAAARRASFMRLEMEKTSSVGDTLTTRGNK
ncbi:hypothetical protein RRF57_011647 [Xylaria bambusicola]|uniref:Uncharacterized protein n=1 Tax=Xylaria bambusicola TaxID=326684 RepID=A0AAN7UN74_9PEZI